MSKHESQHINYRRPGDMPATLPVFSQPGVLLLPRLKIPVSVMDPHILTLVRDAIASHSLIGMVQPCVNPHEIKHLIKSDPELCAVGCAGLITDFRESPSGAMFISVTGISRFEIRREMMESAPYRLFRVSYSDFADDFTPGFGARSVDRKKLLDTFASYLDAESMGKDWREVEKLDSEQLVNTLAMVFPYEVQEKQALLEADDLRLRSEILIALTQKAAAKEAHGANLIKQ